MKQNRRDSGLKVCTRVRMSEITLGITGLHEILGRDYGIQEPYWDPKLRVLIRYGTQETSLSSCK